jgi:hypothetical protein
MVVVTERIDKHIEDLKAMCTTSLGLMRSLAVRTQQTA